MHRRDVSQFSVALTLSHSIETIGRGTLLCFRQVVVSKNAKDRRRGRFHNFSSKNLCLTVPKSFAGDFFCFLEKFSYRKISLIRGGGSEYHNCLLNKNCLTVKWNSQGNLSVFQIISNIQLFHT